MAPHYDLNAIPGPIHDTLCQLLTAFCVELAPLPTVPSCPHATNTQACCPACTVTLEAEKILADVWPPEAPRGESGTFLRSSLEVDVLRALQALYPLPATCLQVAVLLKGGSYHLVGTILKALYMLGAVEKPRRGYYRALEG